MPLQYAVRLFVRSPVIWATNQPGDSQLGDTFLVNWATEVETTGPQLWKCERLTIAVLGQLCAVLGQRPFNITYQTNLQLSSLQSYESCGFNRRIAVFSEPNCAGAFSAHIRLFTHN